MSVDSRDYRLARLILLFGNSSGTFSTARFFSAAASGRPRSLSSVKVSFLMVQPAAEMSRSKFDMKKRDYNYVPSDLNNPLTLNGTDK